MITTRSEMRTEAVSRLEMWGVLPVVIDDFLNGTLNKSEDNGILFYLNDEEKKLVREFEEKSGGIVYHCVLSNTTIGQMLSLLYVSRYKEEWDVDNIDIKEASYTIARVENLTHPELSELGGIVLKPANGGLARTG